MRKILTLAAIVTAFWATPLKAEDQKILNASYDISRELYGKVNEAFIPLYKKETGIDLTIDQSHAGSSKQARSILEGLEADVVTFNQVTDIDILAKGGFVDKDWQNKFPNNASPYYSFPSFLVRAGNPKNIKNWDDLVRDDVKVVFPNPKTSGNARYTYLAAYAFAKEKFAKEDNSDEKAKEFVKKLFANVPVFDTGGRAATTTFIERNIGDVLITFETETINIAREFGAKKAEVVTPEVSLLAEFPVAVVDRVADKRGTRKTAEAYLNFLYSAEGQKILAENGNRVNDPKVKAEFEDRFPKIRLLTVSDVFGSWDKIQKEHFASGQILDQLYEQR
ncbi:sulfate ABC transporter substrate-binding protein [Bartonella sp. HY406]|uniref:sulfate ABC transporter substrate-binding protein n=1 Tax=Bartonella sp. HY406 TaxID=2979331 RepID=UPI0021C80713|nr:sulfate ABC transporter substrate-binding protein [Bartonella sp. HY406]UXN02746.1 sulfate ABC transporter substrate-binding protein [Bartonella sp. HY406]